MRRLITEITSALFVFALIGVAPGISRAQSDNQPGPALQTDRVVAGSLGP
jgi:hypothetical protein